MPKTLIKVDLKTPPEKQPYLHNRWHPEIPIVAWVKPGDEFRIECIDWTGGQIHDDDNAADVRDVALPVLRHRLTLRAEAELDGVTADAVITDILHTAEVPR